MLKADEPVTIGEITAALKDGRLSDEEAREQVKGWDGLEESAKELAKSFGSVKELAESLADTYSGDKLFRALGLDSVDKMQEQWRLRMNALTSPTIPRLPASAFKNPQLEALRALREDIGSVATILETSGEQIGVSAKLAATTVESLNRVHRETKALRDDMAKSNKTITWLTRALVLLGLITLALTAALVWLTWVLAQKP
jgi:hypothetical protein